jgi:glucosamine 6-phosphate synthetase-like amidotransferase/phosphosugar isomerase protein
MCGIFGIVTTKEEQLGPILIQAGQRLAYRGYDSVGCATLHDDGAIDLRKDVGRVEEVAETTLTVFTRNGQQRLAIRALLPWAEYS